MTIWEDFLLKINEMNKKLNTLKPRYILKEWTLFYQNMLLSLFYSKWFRNDVSKKIEYPLVYLSSFYGTTFDPQYTILWGDSGLSIGLKVYSYTHFVRVNEVLVQ